MPHVIGGMLFIFAGGGLAAVVVGSASGHPAISVVGGLLIGYAFGVFHTLRLERLAALDRAVEPRRKS